MRIILIKDLPVTQEIELDTIIASLAPPLHRHSDTLLDLRLWARCPNRAGSCIKAYFDLLGDAPDTDECAQQLDALRNWLESRLNIFVFDGARAVCLDVIPLALSKETDLEQYCHSMMRRLRADRCHDTSLLRLEFGFVRNTPVAA